MTKVTRQWEVPTGKVLSMKTLTLIALMMPTMAFAAPDSDAQLKQKLQVQRQFDGGVTVRAVDKKYVDSAVAKLGGRATVEFSSKDKVSLGGVIVGSGADGLVSRTNTQVGAPIVVTPPVIPKTSITVVGRPNSKMPDSYCVAQVKLGANGEVLTNDYFQLSTDNYLLTFAGSASKCDSLGAPMRVNAGRYMITYNNTFYVVDLKPHENKVIPLREVQVPKYDGNIKFQLYRNFRTALEVNKALVMIKSDWAFRGEAERYTKPSILEAALSELIPGALDSNKLPTLVDIKRNAFYYLATVGVFTTIANDGEIISVLPGEYNILWRFGQQYDYTTGIRVD